MRIRDAPDPTWAEELPSLSASASVDRIVGKPRRLRRGGCHLANRYRKVQRDTDLDEMDERIECLTEELDQ